MDGYKKTSGRNKKKNIIGNDQIHIDSQLKSNRQKSYGSNMSMFPSAIQFNKQLYTTNNEGDIYLKARQNFQTGRQEHTSSFRKQVKFNKSIQNFLDNNQLYDKQKLKKEKK